MDILLLILLSVGFVSGLFSGAVKQLISLAALILGFVVASLYYQQLGEVMGNVVQLPAFCQVVAFLLLWVTVPIVARLVSALLTSMLDKIFVMGLLNRLLGGIFCLAKYAIVLGAFIWLFHTANLIKEETMQASRLCRPLKAVPEFVYNTLKAPSRPCRN